MLRCGAAAQRHSNADQHLTHLDEDLARRNSVLVLHHHLEAGAYTIPVVGGAPSNRVSFWELQPALVLVIRK